MKKNNLLRNSGVQSLLASLMCILVGLLAGYIALLVINAEGAWDAICNIVKNFLYYPKPAQHIHLPLGGRTAPGKARSGRRFLGTNGENSPTCSIFGSSFPRIQSAHIILNAV